MMHEGVSVIVCCYNSSFRLPETLKYLALQKVQPNIKWEVIIIDNASNDNTAQIAQREWEKHISSCFRFTILTQSKPGKSNALQLGVKKAAFEYLIICDDDNWLNDDYVQQVHQIMSNNQKAGLLGGQGIAVSEIPLPTWFKNYERNFAVGKQRSYFNNVSTGDYLWGAGLAFRKQLYDRAYSTTPSLLLGDLSIRGDDVEFCIRVLFMGYVLLYDDKLLFKHYMPKSRLSDEYKNKFLSGNTYEKSVLNLYYKQLQIHQFSFIKKANLGILTFIRLLISRLYSKSRWNNIYECEILHLLTGIPFPNISKESKLVHKIYTQLSFASH